MKSIITFAAALLVSLSTAFAGVNPKEGQAIEKQPTATQAKVSEHMAVLAPNAVLVDALQLSFAQTQKLTRLMRQHADASQSSANVQRKAAAHYVHSLNQLLTPSQHLTLRQLDAMPTLVSADMAEVAYSAR